MKPGGELDVLATVPQWREFWKYLLCEASDNDAWWLDSWLEDHLKEYITWVIGLSVEDKEENEDETG